LEPNQNGKNGRAEKEQKMADGTKRVHKFSRDIRMLGWLGNLDSKD
jgi:hypothetical protein